jgi:methylenetetrahydrofolate--tRNA-(uracil-5-)-methyltransferase
MRPAPIPVIGGGLAGCEAAWQLAERGFDVVLHEMRPVRTTPAHQTDRLAELVCSNTFKSTETTNAHGLLKAEMRALGSVILAAADDARVPGGSALTVDRERFAAAVQARVLAHPRITLVRMEATTLPSPGIVATGPLTSDALTTELQRRLGVESLAFYDAIAPIVAGDSIDTSIAFRASRWGKNSFATSPDPSQSLGVVPADGGDYLNCPMSRDEYEAFLDALIAADQYAGKEFDPVPYFEGCMPVEEMAKRGRDTLRFGPMKPIGLRDPRTGKRPWAVVQLRMEDADGRMWNLVGFQTRMRTAEQRRVLSLIPGLANAEFLRWGSIHRNSYVNAPAALTPWLSLRDDPSTLVAGQLTGVEGYTESTATGLLAGINLARLLHGEEPVIPPATTMLGALYRYLREADPRHFQPMNANFGLVDELPNPPRDKHEKRARIAERALAALAQWREEHAVGVTDAERATGVAS